MLGSRLIGTITQIDMQSLYAQMFERGLSARTIEYTNAVLQSAFRQAVRWKMLAEDPCTGVDLPRVKRRDGGSQRRRTPQVSRERREIRVVLLVGIGPHNRDEAQRVLGVEVV